MLLPGPLRFGMSRTCRDSGKTPICRNISNCFRLTFLAIKEVDERFRVGGPAICGVNDEVLDSLVPRILQRQQTETGFHHTPSLHYGGSGI
jgi:hypothetical protein